MNSVSINNILTYLSINDNLLYIPIMKRGIHNINIENIKKVC